jgi:hypothetical protein
MLIAGLRNAEWVTVAVVALWGAWPTGHAHAFSDPTRYMAATKEGGGGGRWFTGSSADGYGCDVCHDGGTPANLSVTGLPLQGFMPGVSYEISLSWPASVQHLVLIAEFTDEHRQGAGTIALPRPDAMMPSERCGMELGGFPATQVSDAEPGRKLVSVIDCGAKSTRFLWTAPTTPQGTLWFNAGFVTSNVDAAASGDGVTMVSRALLGPGASLDARKIAQGCSVSSGGGRSSQLGLFVLLLWAGALGLWRVRTHGRSHDVTSTRDQELA